MKQTPAHLGLLTIVLMLSCSTARGADAPTAGACTFERGKLATQDLKTFDQKPEGWRSVAMQGPACQPVVADLIAEYRKLHPDLLANPNAYLLFWHEGQARAAAGQDEQALALFEQSRGPDHPLFKVWGLYVDATIAFIRRDRPSLQKARDALAAVPTEAARPSAQLTNIDVVDGLLLCFDRSYAQAYDCRSKPAAP